MEYRKLGSTGLQVSRLCFGSLTIGPLQANLSVAKGAELLRAAFDRGVNFLDTAELYQSYPYIKEAIKHRRQEIVVSTKCYAYSKEGAEESLKRALKELGTDYIDIFSLHEQESAHTLRGHYEALEYFVRAKEKGYIRAVGISTHAVDAVRASLKYPEIEVVHPLINRNGLGILDGSLEEMLAATKAAHDAGKGIYAMKALGGGNLLANVTECFQFVLDKAYIDSIACGMQSIEELEANLFFFEHRRQEPALTEKIKQREKKLFIDFWCEGCGACVRACKQHALSLVDGKAVVDPKKCLLCGYCGAYCKDFCIKVF